MYKFSEELLQFIWKYRLIKPGPLTSVAGSLIEVLKPGDLNRDAGPDFFNGQVRIDGVLLAGNIEVHLRTSDWLKHGHQADASYNNLALHVVYEHDTVLDQNAAHGVHVLELRHHIDDSTLSAYEALSSAEEKLPCAAQLPALNDLHFSAWLERMMVERLESKVKRIEGYFAECRGDLVEVFYLNLFRNFGFRVNALPFEMLARRLPAHLLLRHSHSLLQLESLLLGMSGLLETMSGDKYVRLLQNEFSFLRDKYKLVPLSKELFKYSRLRPANFPDLRLAQLAALLHARPRIVSSPHQGLLYAELVEALATPAGTYWQDHYAVDAGPHKMQGNMGLASIEGIIVNSFVPFYFFYDTKFRKPALREAALALLEACAPETNYKTRLFKARRSQIKSAAQSQALLQLYDHYCSRKRCLECGLAASLLKPRVNS